MNLLMIGGDRSMLQGKKGAFWYTLEAFHTHWDRIDVICPKVQEGAIQERCFFGNVHFHPSPFGLWYQPLWIKKKGSALIEKYGHSVMTAHEYPPFYNGIGAEMLMRTTSVPYVLEIHHIVGYPHSASLFEWIGKWLSALFLPHDAAGADAVRCVNHATVHTLTRWGAERNKLFVVPSFYLDRELLGSAPLPDKLYDVVCAGRLVENKGFAEVIRAVALLPTATLLIIGDGPLRKKLEQLATQLGISDRVEFAGWLPENTDVYRAIRSGSVFVMNSKSEGGPRVALEAMALGVPIVTTAVGAMPDVIKEGVERNGYITTGTPKDLAKKLEKLVGYPSLCERLGNEAKAIRNTFERQKLIKQYAQFVQKVARKDHMHTTQANLLSDA